MDAQAWEEWNSLEQHRLIARVAAPLNSMLKYLIVVRSGEPGYHHHHGRNHTLSYDNLENSYPARFQELGDMIRDRISGSSRIHIACSAVGVGQETAHILRSQLQGHIEVEIAGCLGYLTEKIDKWNWAGDLGYNLLEVDELVQRRRKEAEVLILVGGLKVAQNYPGKFTDQEYNLGEKIPWSTLPLYFGGFPHGYARMLDVAKREWTQLPGPAKMISEGCRQSRNDGGDKRSKAAKESWRKRKAVLLE